ncbi:MAG: OmpA family protein [Terriglobia bacterium]
MNRLRLLTWGTASAALALILFSSGCATKKFVRNSVEPLETRLGKVEEQSGENSRRITDVDQKAEQGISEAKAQADTANKQATQADQHAGEAQTLAQKGVSEAESVREELRNADNFQTLKTETVQFDFDRSQLTDAAKQKLDEITSTVSSLKRYVIEIQGFTDQTGPERYNLDLSRRRAESVVRYLTTNGKVPLARVYEIGYGEDSPVAPNNTREGREENRRVEIKVLAVQQASSQATQAQAATSGTAANQ